MRAVFLWSYYERYLASFYEKHPGFSEFSYNEQLQLLLEDYFGEVGSYTRWARELGHDAIPIIRNCEPMQRRWALENGVPFGDDWQRTIAIEQVKRIRPDVFFMESIFDLYGRFLDEIKKHAGKTMGWISCPIPPGVPLHQMDLIVSSAPGFVDTFRKMGINSEFLLAAFDPDILERLPEEIKQDVDLSFIGGISPAHKNRYRFLHGVSQKTPLKLWGYSVDSPSVMNRIRRRLFGYPLEEARMGEVWGLEMYRILKRSKITLNCHIDVAGKFAGNMRMFEATGVGTLLITDNQSNLADLFVPGKEVVAYDSVDDAVEKINYYLTHEKERLDVAKAGQRRTLSCYNYRDTVRQLFDYFEKY